jgi:hypothetical protein
MLGHEPVGFIATETFRPDFSKFAPGPDEARPQGRPLQPNLMDIRGRAGAFRTVGISPVVEAAPFAPRCDPSEAQDVAL